MTNVSRAVSDFGALSGLGPELAEALVRLSSDIALVVRPDGLIEKVVQSDANPMAGADGWVGQQWVDTVTRDTRPKIEKLLQETAATGVGRRREVNHPLAPGEVLNAIPMAYTAIQLGLGGPLLAVGRDLRAIAAIQQRFFDAQRETEKLYWQSRREETRYRLLFQAAADAMLLVDGGTLNILESNRAAAQLFDLSEEALAGRPATWGFDPHSAALVEELMERAQHGAPQAEVRARLDRRPVYASVSVTRFRVGEQLRLLMRVHPQSHAIDSAAEAPEQAVADEAVVLTDTQGRVLTANRAFHALLGVGPDEPLSGRSLEPWLGGVLEVLIEGVRAQGIVRRTDTLLRLPDGHTLHAQISAVVVPDDDQERIGFTIYPVARIAPSAPAEEEPPPSPADASAAALGQWLGTGSLDTLVARAERLLMAQALERSGGDLEACASLLGLTRSELAARVARGSAR